MFLLFQITISNFIILKLISFYKSTLNLTIFLMSSKDNSEYNNKTNRQKIKINLQLPNHKNLPCPLHFQA